MFFLGNDYSFLGFFVGRVKDEKLREEKKLSVLFILVSCMVKKIFLVLRFWCFMLCFRRNLLVMVFNNLMLYLDVDEF